MGWGLSVLLSFESLIALLFCAPFILPEEMRDLTRAAGSSRRGSPRALSHSLTPTVPGQTWRTETAATWCLLRRPTWRVWSWSYPPMPTIRAILLGVRSWLGWRTWPPLQPGERRHLAAPQIAQASATCLCCCSGSGPQTHETGGD